MLKGLWKMYNFKPPRFSSLPWTTRPGCASLSLGLTWRNAADDTEMKQNPFYDKYADKITSLQRTAPEKLRSRFDALRDQQKSKFGKNHQPERTSQKERGSLTDQAASKPSYTQKKNLDDLLNVKKLLGLSVDDIATVWKEFHQNKECIWSVIPGETYQRINSRSIEFPTFLYPVPRRSGYEFFVGQFLGHSCYFTPLIAYQAHTADAPSCLSIMHYPDLQNEKGIVLMDGEYDIDVVRADEAQLLANQLQLYYTSNRTSKKASLLWTFNKEPSSFKHMDLVAELEATSLAEIKPQ